MRKELKISATVLTSILCVSLITPVFSQNYQNPYNYNNYNNYTQNYNQKYLQPLQGRVATAPAGTILATTISTPISSQFARVGDRITTTLGQDLSIGGNLVLPAGSQIEGQIIELQKAGRFNRGGKINVRFTNAITPNGQRFPISAKIATQDGTGIIYGGTTATTVAKTLGNTAIGAGLGAALGTGLGAASGGTAGKGAVYGTAIGSGVGLAGNFVTKGADAVIPANTKIDIILDQPLTVNAGPESSY